MNMNQNKFLLFELCSENYAIPILSAREIIQMMEITHIPKAPPFITGVINLKGNIIPVIDLRVKFALPETSYNKKTCIIIIETEEKTRLMGVIVDTVSEVVNISDISKPPEFNHQHQMDFLYGVGKVNDSVVWILNLDKIVSCDELVIIDNIKKELA